MEYKRSGICVAGNIIVDTVYPITDWPGRGELTDIAEGVSRSTGGAVCNVVIDLAKLDKNLPLAAAGLVGEDEAGDYVLSELKKHASIDTSRIKRKGLTSFTLVMSDQISKQRTFFTNPGASGEFCEEYIDWENMPFELFHIGYIFLLPALDQPDDEYGTKMARLLCHAKQSGLKTSLDVVSKAGQSFREFVPPSLRYTDYCIINELEAEQITGIPLRDKKGTLIEDNMPQALYSLLEMGVSTWAVIHCPESGFGMEKGGTSVSVPGLRLPQGFIKDSVGAGDAFCAGILYSVCKNKTIEEAIKMGIAAAVCSLSESGSSGGVRSAEKAVEFFQSMCKKSRDIE